MRTQAHQARGVVVRFQVEEHKIRLDVAIGVVFSVAGKRVVNITRGERFIVGQTYLTLSSAWSSIEHGSSIGSRWEVIWQLGMAALRSLSIRSTQSWAS